MAGTIIQLKFRMWGTDGGRDFYSKITWFQHNMPAFWAAQHTTMHLDNKSTYRESSFDASHPVGGVQLHSAVGLSNIIVLAIYRDILKVSISQYFLINYHDTIPVHYCH